MVFLFAVFSLMSKYISSQENYGQLSVFDVKEFHL